MPDNEYDTDATERKAFTDFLSECADSVGEEETILAVLIATLMHDGSVDGLMGLVDVSTSQAIHKFFDNLRQETASAISSIDEAIDSADSVENPEIRSALMAASDATFELFDAIAAVCVVLATKGNECLDDVRKDPSLGEYVTSSISTFADIKYKLLMRSIEFE